MQSAQRSHQVIHIRSLEYEFLITGRCGAFDEPVLVLIKIVYRVLFYALLVPVDLLSIKASIKAIDRNAKPNETICNLVLDGTTENTYSANCHSQIM